MSQCARPDCQAVANSSCSGCGREQYCGSVCQKLDWKVHKSLCPIFKKLSSQLQPYNEVVRITKEILASNKGNDIRVLEHLMSYADYQFGKQVAGRDHRERMDGQRIANWDVEIEILLKISNNLVNIYSTNSSLSTMIRDKGMNPHIERSLQILSPLMDTIDSDATNQSNSLNSIETYRLLKQPYALERNMAILALSRNQYDIAERHCHRCLVNSRRFRVEGEDKTTSIFEALHVYVNLRRAQGDSSGAVTFAEEAYNLVVDAYDPVHPQVQEAASWLIESLIQQGDFSNAERFSEQTYANLRDIKNGMDQEGEQVAKGAYNLAEVIFRQGNGDLIKAEGLARESIRIKDQLYGAHDRRTGVNYLLLSRILRTQGEFGDETKELLERSLAIFTINEGPDGMNTAVVNIEIGEFHYNFAMVQSTISMKRTQLQLAKSYSEEAIRIELKIHNPTHPSSIVAASLLSNVLDELSKV
jgi:tetratricopeptide (TPR) repeat protein